MGNKLLDINRKSHQRLKSWMRENKISQKDLAKGVDYTPQYLSSVITGKKRLTYELALRIEGWSQQEPNTSDWWQCDKWWKPDYYKNVCPVSRFWLLAEEDNELIRQIDRLTKWVEELKAENQMLREKLGEISTICLWKRSPWLIKRGAYDERTD